MAIPGGESELLRLEGVGRNVWLDGNRDLLIVGHEIEMTYPVSWLIMQIAMLAGFLTSYPVDGWLLRAGIKEKI